MAPYNEAAEALRKKPLRWQRPDWLDWLLDNLRPVDTTEVMAAVAFGGCCIALVATWWLA